MSNLAYQKEKALSSLESTVAILAAIDLLIEQLQEELICSRFQSVVNRTENLQSIFKRLQTDELETLKTAAGKCIKAKGELLNAG